jgi:serine/threonine-protein kinase CHEK1
LLISISVRIAKDLKSPQLYAVKFIDKISALNGHDPKSGKGHAILHQIALEVALHRTCAQHRNVIGFEATMETPVWRWIALEFAEGGDLFDKIGI